MKNIVISTGGSGGHVKPAIALYEYLEKDNKVFITTDKRGPVSYTHLTLPTNREV